ncbi:hypothetical protein EVAR_77977_1 [Eumeta japonica]|uniref:Uncharacterized protein n=1 Tax=Eumeta variegata TaxID=151549 RepID=A0A4C1T0Q5_EUMVA|nr:hypothetical protein EVAR_77977_1 [Eumeta japonica]
MYHRDQSLDSEDGVDGSAMLCSQTTSRMTMIASPSAAIMDGHALRTTPEGSRLGIGCHRWIIKYVPWPTDKMGGRRRCVVNRRSKERIGI